jgi:N-acetylmuramate 1-kinase
VTVNIDLDDARATERLGEDLARALKKGDVLTLYGDVGAGKSTLARGLIRALAHDADLDVPSPTFTLVQSYELRIPVSHFDLYRLNDLTDLDELGLDEAAAQGIALVEWPERAGNRLPANSIKLKFREAGEGRNAVITGPQEAMERIERALTIRQFLTQHGFGTARRSWFQGDASTRSFEKIEVPDRPDMILMDHPEKPDLSPIVNGRSYRQTARITWTVTPFVAVSRTLMAHGFAAPDIVAIDLDAGILLMENLGDGKVTDASGAPISERYMAAVELLAKLHDTRIARDLPIGNGRIYTLPPYDRDALLIEARLMIEWYVPYRLGRAASEADSQEFNTLWDELIALLERSETGLILRDYHSPNLIWRNDRTGTDRLGLVDIQDALYGPLSYDVSSLAQDARVTIPAELEAELLAAYCSSRHARGTFDEAGFREAYAITALQRATKILGIFVRLDKRDGKPDYLKHLPRIEAYVKRALSHPRLAKLSRFYSSFLN